jgi:hypothetical protein
MLALLALKNSLMVISISKRGLTPREMRLGRRILISAEAAAECDARAKTQRAKNKGDPCLCTTIGMSSFATLPSVSQGEISWHNQASRPRFRQVKVS